MVGTGLALALITALATGGARAVRFARSIALLTPPEGALPPGGTAVFRIAVRARSTRLPAARVRLALVSGVRRYSTELDVSAGASGPRELCAPQVPRGLYRTATLALRFTDIFALVETRLAGAVPADGPAAVTRVLPDVRTTSRGFDARGAGTERLDAFLSHHRNDDHIETRPYHPGDDMRRINWRMYAHTGDLFVRVGEEVPPPAKAIRLLIDSRGLTAPGEIDVLLKHALGVADELVRRDYAVMVSLGDIDGTSRLLGDPARARYVLAGLDPERGLLPMSFGRLRQGEASDPSKGGDAHTQPLVRSSEPSVPFSSARELVVACSRSPASPAMSGEAAIVAWYRADRSAKEADVYHLGAFG